MGLGGLLANAVGGGVVGAAEGAVEQYDRNEKKEALDLKSQRDTSLEMLRSSNNRQNDQLRIEAQAEQGDKDRASREHIANLASKKGSRTVKAWEPITQKDMNGNITVIGKFNSVTGERDMFDAAPGTAMSEELQMQAEEYADKVVSEKAGLLSTDATDFNRFEGSREKARQFYIQEFLQQRGGADPVNMLEDRFGKR